MKPFAITNRSSQRQRGPVQGVEAKPTSIECLQHLRDLRPKPGPCSTEDRRYLWTVLPNGAWSGQRAFVVAGGPSLKGLDLSFLRGELVITVNRSFELYDAAMNYSMDTQFMEMTLAGKYRSDAKYVMNRRECTKVWFEDKESCVYPGTIGPLGADVDIPNSYVIRSTHGSDFVADLRAGICTGPGNNSGLGAINIAVALKASPVYLLGFDMQYRGGKKEWWHNGYPNGARQRDDVYRRMVGIITSHADAIRRAGSKVVNLNPESGLRCFEFGRIEDLEPTAERPLIIGYYTRNTSYEAEIKHMTASVHRFGLEHETTGVDTMGGWQANTYYKAKFLRAALDQHPDRPLLFLDADVEMKRYPALFDNLPSEFAINRVNWAQYSRKGNGQEVNTSVIYLRRTPSVVALLDDWIRVNERLMHTGTWEQRNLQNLLESGWAERLNMTWLPDQYCQIFDLMAEAGDPVIELHQASRRTKKEVGA